MILSDTTIRSLNIVSPCEGPGTFRGKSYGLSHAGYDACVDLSDIPGYPMILSDISCKVLTPDGDGISLRPGRGTLVSLVEHFDIPTDVVGYTRDKSTWSRQGLLMAQAVLEPGWKGYLSLWIFNAGPEPLTIVHREPIAQVIFHRLDQVPERTYAGKYQGQGRGPQEPR